MSLWCYYCQTVYSCRQYEKYRCQRPFEKTQENAAKVTSLTETSNGSPGGIERGKAFQFKTPLSILVVGPSGCGKTCRYFWVTHKSCLVHPPEVIHYCYGAC